MSKKFKSEQANKLLSYVAKKYGRDMEYLWARMPDDGIWRRVDNDKWFGGMFHVRKDKIIAGPSADIIEILDIRCAPDVIDFIVDKKLVFPGWHMNKRHWITIVLDGRMELGQIKNLLDNSFELAGGK